MSADWSEYWLVVMSGDWSGSSRRPVRGPAGGLVGDRARTDRRTDREDRDRRTGGVPSSDWSVQRWALALAEWS
jgi:hypothetical protein